MSLVERQLLNDFQRNFPLAPRPFAKIAKQLKTDSRVVLSTLKSLRKRGMVSRIGPVFRPHAIGASTLATMAVPTAEIEHIAAIVNQFEAVNHNYEREHDFNLWFVVTAEDQAQLQSELSGIEKATGYTLISLPLVVGHHIDLGFRMNLDGTKRSTVKHYSRVSQPMAEALTQDDSLLDELLIETIQFGLPLVGRPYRAVGKQIGRSEAAVIERIERMQTSGTIKRFGVVVRHRELGYRANAMLVWDIPEDRVDKLGEQLSQLDCVTLCYQRQRHLPEWSYNLFCMIHGRDRSEVERCIEDIIERFALHSLPHQVLFSTRRFKQRGARYRSKGTSAHSSSDCCG
jgi:DNA-binding Lrp family transcriptional regulator